MIGKIVLAVFLIATLPVYAQDKAYVYDDHGKNDPFRPILSETGEVIKYDTQITIDDMKLEGILGDPKGNNVAIINGKIVKPSDKAGPFTVEAVGLEQVDLSKDGEHFMLKLKKGGT